MLPSVTVIVPTYNSEDTLGECLNSIEFQNYPKDKVEVLVVDGGSTDGTVSIASRFNVKILSNPRRSGEAGKATGVSAARNEIIAFVDSDNVLPDRDWLLGMVEPFSDESVVGSEPLYYTYRKEDSLITRYCALLGMNDVLCLYSGNYDRYSHLTGKWTGLEVNFRERPNYMVLQLDGKAIPTIGANGFLVRRNALMKVDYKPFLVDVDSVHQLIALGYNNFAKVKRGIVHLFADTTEAYVRKTRRRVSEYLYYSSFGMRRYPWSGLRRKGVARLVMNALFLPSMTREAVRGYRRKPDVAWFFHIFACWLTVLIYGSFYVSRLGFGARTRGQDESERTQKGRADLGGSGNSEAIAGAANRNGVPFENRSRVGPPAPEK